MLNSMNKKEASIFISKLICKATSSIILIYPIIQLLNQTYHKKNFFTEKLFKGFNYQIKNTILNIGLVSSSYNPFKLESGNGILYNEPQLQMFLKNKTLNIREKIGGKSTNQDDIKDIKNVIKELKENEETIYHLGVRKDGINHAMGMKILKTKNKISIELLNSAGWMNFSGGDFSKYFKNLFLKALENQNLNIKIEVKNNTKCADQGPTPFCVQYTYYNLNKEFFNDIGVDFKTQSRKNFNGRLNFSLYALSKFSNANRQAGFFDANKELTLEKLKANSEYYKIFTTKFKESLDLALPKSGNIKKDDFENSFLDISSLSLKSIEDIQKTKNKIK